VSTWTKRRGGHAAIIVAALASFALPVSFALPAWFAVPAAAQEPPPSDPPIAPPPAPPAPRRAPLDLMPDEVLSSIAGAERDDVGPVDDAQRAIHQAEDWLVDGQRRDAIQHGVVAPYYREVERTLRHGFHPDLAAIAAERRASQTPIQIIADELMRYGPPEAPHDARGTPTPELRGRTPEEIQALNAFDTYSLLNAHTRWQRVEVHVEQDREGAVTRATVTHSSDSRLLDEAALVAVREAALAHPPEDLLGTRTAITSDWAFWAGEVVPFIGAMTPGGGATGGLSCMDGPEGEGMQCTALGRPLLRTRVELLDVHDAAHERRDRLPIREDAHALGDPSPDARVIEEPAPKA
jgi:TonB family protein